MLKNPHLFDKADDIVKFFKEIGTAAKACDAAGMKGLNAAFKFLKSEGKQVKGVKYEFTVAAHYINNAAAGVKVQFRKIIGKQGTKGFTDLDLIIDGVIIEAKISANAVRPGKIVTYLQKILDNSDARDGISKIVLECGQNLSDRKMFNLQNAVSDVKLALEQLGITVELRQISSISP